ALAALVPVLADYPRFDLDVHCELHGAEAHLRVAPPVLLPAGTAPPQRATSPAERLARDLEVRGQAVQREPPPIASGEHLLFPELAITRGDATWLVEILGFSTEDS